MDTIMILNEAEAAIGARDKAYQGVFYMCWLDEKIQCVPWDKAEKAEFVFASYRDATLTAGLTSKQWNQLEGNVRVFLKEEKS